MWAGRACYQVLSIQNAMELYENNYVYHVPDAIYAQLSDELAAFEAHIAPLPPEEPEEEEE